MGDARRYENSEQPSLPQYLIRSAAVTSEAEE
jgi:hypothetical protein